MKCANESQPMIPTELVTMSQSHVIEAGMRADPDVAKRPELKTLYSLNMLNIMGGMRGLFEMGRAHRQFVDTMADEPGMTEDARRQMAETSLKAEPILRALLEAGLTRQAESFRTAMSLASDENADFAALLGCPEVGGEFADVIAAYVARTPALAAWVARVRATLDDDERMYWLVKQLAAMSEEARAQLPKALNTIHAISYFEGQVSNGGIHQAFFNSSGDLAPEVVAGLHALGLIAHAEIVERGIAMFSTPYPRDTGLRRDTDFREGGNEWHNRLAALGQDWDFDAIQPSLIELARHEGVLPK